MNPPLVTELVRFDYSVLPPGYRCPAHLHHYFQVDVILEGRVRVAIEGRAFVARAGDAWLIPPLVRHGYDSRERYRHGSFKFHLGCRYWPSFNAGFHRFRVPGALRQAVEEAGRHQQERHPLAAQHGSAVLTLALVEAAGRAPTATSADESLDSFRRSLWPLLEQIAGQRGKPWTVAGLARECHLSTDHFSRRFQSALGMKPTRYLQEARLRSAAVDLLADPPVSIKEAAHRAGYATVHAFTRAFTRVFSASPAAYRAMSSEL